MEGQEMTEGNPDEQTRVVCFVALGRAQAEED